MLALELIVDEPEELRPDLKINDLVYERSNKKNMLVLCNFLDDLRIFVVCTNYNKKAMLMQSGWFRLTLPFYTCKNSCYYNTSYVQTILLR